MISNWLQIMDIVRTKLLEGFTLPGLDMSYWDFCICLLILGLIIKLLVNHVPQGNVSKQKGKNNSSESKED